MPVPRTGTTQKPKRKIENSHGRRPELHSLNGRPRAPQLKSCHGAVSGMGRSDRATKRQSPAQDCAAHDLKHFHQHQPGPEAPRNLWRREPHKTEPHESTMNRDGLAIKGSDHWCATRFQVVTFNLSFARQYSRHVAIAMLPMNADVRKKKKIGKKTLLGEHRLVNPFRRVSAPTPGPAQKILT